MLKIENDSLKIERIEQAKERQKIQSLVPKIFSMIAKKDYARALNSFVYLFGECGDSALLEEKAQWYEEMGRLCLKLKRHPNEASRYFRFAIYALSLLDDKNGIEDLIKTYEDDFSGDAKKNWTWVLETRKELDYCRLSS